jgi:predicted alpha-1,2-mannosidase
MGMDGAVHAAAGRVQYADVSGWDVYRSEIPLLALLDPVRAGDIVQSLLTDARDAGCLPKWPVASSQTQVMVGDPADPIIAGADAFGARGFDRSQALLEMVKGATRTCRSTTSAAYVERQGLGDYLRLGYVPDDDDVRSGNAGSASGPGAVWGSAATTLEYAVDDFAIAAFAARLGDAPDAGAFLLRAQNWRNLFNPATRYIQPRSGSGAFNLPYTPASDAGFVEGSAAQYVWAVPHDLNDLFQAMGGAALAARRLDAFLSRLNSGPHSDHAFLGNEPTLGAPWEYDWLGQPYKTQRAIRAALLALYHPAPRGYPGNDDLGELSSWYVFGALGMYPEIPGTDLLALGSPLFRRAVLHLARGTLVIDAPEASDRRPYVRRMTLNGTCVDQPWLRWAWLAGGGRLAYRLSVRPDPGWGSAPAALPPSLPVSDAPAGPAVVCPARR